MASDSEKLRRTFLVGVSALALATQPTLAGTKTSVQWGVDRTVSPQTLCVYDGSNICKTVLSLSPSGAIPFVASNAALRAFDPANSPNVTRMGFADAGDAPPLTFVWKATCPGTPDNVAFYITPNAGGVGCWSSAADPNVDDLREWGEVNDATPTTCGAGSVDNGPIIQVAVDALGAGHTLRQSGGWACIKSGGNGANGVLISQPAEGVVCDGMIGASGGRHDVGNEFTGPNGFIGYTYGATLFKFKSATTQVLYGNFMACPIAGNNLSGTFGQAAIGVDAFSVRNGSWRIAPAHFQTSGFQADIDTSVGEAAGSSGNEYWIYGDQTLVFDGSFFICNGTVSWDCSQDTFRMIYGLFSGAQPVLEFNGADSEIIENATAYDSLAGGAACGIKLSAANNDLQTARNMMMNYVGFTNETCSVYAEGTENGKSTPSHSNTILNYDTPNNPIQPTIGAGASLNWATTNTPPGYNYFTTNGLSVSTRDAGGIGVNQGTTNSIAGGGSQTITFPGPWSVDPTPGTYLPFSHQCTSSSATPGSAATSHVVCLTTAITVFNDGVGAASFRWSATGY